MIYDFKYNKILYVLVIITLCFSCKDTKKLNKKVTLKGSIINYDQDTLFMNNITSKFMFFKENIQSIELKNKTNFDYKFELDKPTYFKIGRTFLYLSPGDSLEVSLDSKSRSLGSFSGKGAEVNNYLTRVPYPKGGSYWGEREISSKFITYKDVPDGFKKIIDARRIELNNLNNTTEEFRRLENARIKFDYVNSLQSISYLYYNKVRKGEITQQEMYAKSKEAKTYFTPFIKQYLDDFNDTSYLQLEVFQTIIYSLNDEDFMKNHNLSELSENLQDYFFTNQLVNSLKRDGYSNKLGNKLKDGVKKVDDKNYKYVLQNLQNEYETITKGNAATDLTFNKLDNSTVKLKDYKGKVIVLDLWATWCGPCMKEKPFYEALERKYHGTNKVEFISLSIDTEKVWRNYFEKNKITGNQLQINRNLLSNYKVAGIPRFFVIDQEFNIVDVFAPVPSSGDLEVIINNTLDQKL